MIKFIIFSIVMLTLGVTDISVMSRANLKREIVPYAILAAAAMFVAFFSFTAGRSAIGGAERLFGGAW